MGIPSPDEINLSDIADTIPNGHLVLRRVERNLLENVVELFRFYTKKDSNQEKTGIPFQYMEENQGDWANYTTPISTALSTVDNMIMEKYSKLYSLDIIKPNPVPMQLSSEQQQPSIIQMIGSQQGEEKSKPSVWDRMFGRGGSSAKSSITPFRLIIPEVEKKRKIMASWFGDELECGYIPFHNYRISWCKKFNLVGEGTFQFTDYMGMMNFLEIEKTEFKNRIGPVLTLISEGHNIVRNREQVLSTDIFTSLTQVSEKHRQNNYGRI